MQTTGDLGMLVSGDFCRHKDRPYHNKHSRVMHVSVAQIAKVNVVRYNPPNR